MKTRIRQLAAALFLAFIVTGSLNATAHKVEASSHETNQEASMELENWMTDENVWNTSAFRSFEVHETTLKLENWMTNRSVWDVQYESLNLEDWMINEKVWDVENTTASIVEPEQSLAIENWMMNDNTWKI